MAAFCDANILWSPNQKLMNRKIETAIKLGFDVVISNYEVPDLQSQTKKTRKNKQQGPTMKTAAEVRIPTEVLRAAGGPNRKIEQYTRCTAILTDVAQTTRINNSKDIQAYDIIAITPTCEKTFQLACGTLEADIISLDMTKKLTFSMKRTQVNLNVIISSACEKAIEVRSPYDAANLGLLFGMNKEQCKAALSLNCRNMLYHAKSRKTAITVLSLERTCDLESPEKDSEAEVAITTNTKSETNGESPKKRQANDVDPSPRKKKKKKTEQ